MKTIATITLVLLIFLSCSNEKINPEKPEPSTSNNNVENFDSFFDKFSSDSVFQRSHIKFPLMTESFDVGSDKTNTSTVNADKWSFFNIKKTE